MISPTKKIIAFYIAYIAFYIIIIVLFFFLGFFLFQKIVEQEPPVGASLGADDTSVLENKVKNDLQANGKFKHIPRKDNRQVDEYELPTGEIGYTISMWKTVGSKEYKKVKNFGPLTERNTGWVLIRDNTATSTR